MYYNLFVKVPIQGQKKVTATVKRKNPRNGKEGTDPRWKLCEERLVVRLILILHDSSCVNIVKVVRENQSS